MAKDTQPVRLAAQVMEEMDLKVYGTMDEEKVQSVQNTIGDRSTLLLLTIGDWQITNRRQKWQRNTGF